MHTLKNKWSVTFLALLAVLVIAGCNRSNSDTQPATTENAPASNTATETRTAPANKESTAPRRAAEARPEPRMITIPAGTSLEVTVDQNVSSKTSTEGDHFAASLAAPVIIGGKQMLASGSSASGSVVVAKSAGRFAGNAELGLALDSITVDGRRYKVATTTYSEKSGSRGKRTALGTGIGAAAGAAIGAIVGGGKGAAIGAGAGAGGGAAGTALTGQRDVDVPAESKITFELSEPLTIPAPQG
jgi:glucose/arabinose dehydrogenase